MQIIVTLESNTGKTITERIKSTTAELAERIATAKNKNCTVVNVYTNLRSMSKDRW